MRRFCVIQLHNYYFVLLLMKKVREVTLKKIYPITNSNGSFRPT